MKVCAWANLSPYQHVIKKFDSQADGLKWFRNYGRDVGYNVDRIELSEELEAIRATDIRKEMQHG